MSPAGEPLAKPGMRIVARFLDGLILGVIGYLVALALIGPDDASSLDNFGGDVNFDGILKLSSETLAALPRIACRLD